MIAGDEARGAGACAFRLQHGGSRARNARVSRKPEIVVRCKVCDALAVQQHGAGAALLHRPHRAAKTSGLQ
jgi:hypothetical protein